MSLWGEQGAPLVWYRGGGSWSQPGLLSPQLAQEARRIYDEFLSSHSVSPVNIDKQAWIGEDMLATPSPDMFRIQQLQVWAVPDLHPQDQAVEPPYVSPSITAVTVGLCHGAVAGACGCAGVLSTHILLFQIFNLMKFDSYTRFVKSPLYQACLRAESQGQPLPDLRPHSRSSSPPPDLSKVSEGERAMGTCPHAAGSLPCCSTPGWGQTSSQGTREREGENSGVAILRCCSFHPRSRS